MIHINEYETIKITKNNKYNTLFFEYVDTSANYGSDRFILNLNKNMVDELINKLVDIHVEMEKINNDK